MRKLIIILLVLGVHCVHAQRQIDERSGWGLKDRLYTGGGFGLNGGTDYYGNKYFSVQLSPIVGYMITSNFSAGTGITYNYMRYSDVPQLGSVTLHQYGVSPFLRYNVKQFFGQVEYNLISTPYFNDTSKRQTFDRFLAGIGISQPLGQRSSLNILAMYDLLYDNLGPFASPWVFRVYVSI